MVSRLATQVSGSCCSSAVSVAPAVYARCTPPSSSVTGSTDRMFFFSASEMVTFL